MSEPAGYADSGSHFKKPSNPFEKEARELVETRRKLERKEDEIARNNRDLESLERKEASLMKSLRQHVTEHKPTATYIVEDGLDVFIVTVTKRAGVENSIEITKPDGVLAQ